MRPGSTHRTASHRGFRLLAQVCRPMAAALARWELPPVLPVGAPALFAGNHRSMFDMVVGLRLFWNFRASVRIVVAERYFRRPLMGPLLRITGAIPLAPGKAALAGLKACLVALERGESVVIMPEGRLIGAGERPEGVGPVAAGVGVLAGRTGVPVALCALTGTDEVWPPGRRLPRLRLPRNRPTVRARVESLVPLTPAERADRERVAEAVMVALAELVDRE